MVLGWGRGEKLCQQAETTQRQAMKREGSVSVSYLDCIFGFRQCYFLQTQDSQST